MHGGGFSRRDRAGAILAALFILILGAASLTKGVPKWGDDFAAYISEGIAIADGSFREQAVKNFDLHPAQLAEEAGEDGLVYVWGYPLMLAGIYKLTGFNRVDYSTMIWYKIPLLLSLSLLAAVLVLFYRRRFPLPAAFAAALLICMSGDFFKALNNLYSDLPFLFFQHADAASGRVLCRQGLRRSFIQ